jgi:hypothetical protein
VIFWWWFERLFGAVYLGTAVPLHEGKTASGQVEMLQLYHRISVVLKGIRSAADSPTISTTERRP